MSRKNNRRYNKAYFVKLQEAEKARELARKEKMERKEQRIGAKKAVKKTTQPVVGSEIKKKKLLK